MSWVGQFDGIVVGNGLELSVRETLLLALRAPRNL
jgi:hypothetical protein